LSETFITDTDFRAFVEPSGNVLLFSFEKVHELRPWPPTERWKMVHAGRIHDAIRHIGRRCADIEDGAIRLDNPTRIGSRMNLSAMQDSRFFAEKQLAALRRPVPVIALPETVTITDRSNDVWQWSDFGSPTEMRRQFDRQFDHLLEASGTRTEDGWTVRVDQNIDLLLQLDEFAWGWHDAWPDTRMPSEHGVTPYGAPIFDANAAPEMSVTKIDGFQDLFLVEHNDSPFFENIPSSPLKIMNGPGTIRNYWNNYFPSAAGYQLWTEDLRHIKSRLSPSNSAIPVAPSAINLTKPKDAPSSVMDLWRNCAGDRDEILLADAIKNLMEISWNNAEWKMEHLAKFCGVGIEPPDLSIVEDEDCGPR
jgi:hypothetical protein